MRFKNFQGRNEKERKETAGKTAFMLNALI